MARQRIRLFKAQTIARISTAAISAIVIACWLSLRTSFKTASMEEVRHVLPAEVLRQGPPSEAELQRFASLVAKLPVLDELQADRICNPSQPAELRYRTAVQFWQKDRGAIEGILTVLKDGAVRAPYDISRGIALWLGRNSLTSFARVTIASALLFGANGDFTMSTRLLTFLEALGDSLLHGHGDLLQYQLAVQIVSGTSDAIVSNAKVRGFPIADCRSVLAGLSPAPDSDEALADSIKTDFSLNMMPWLPDPTKGWVSPKTDRSEQVARMSFSQPGLGTYDAIQTATVYAKILSTALANARMPYSQFDRSTDETIKRASFELPHRQRRNRNFVVHAISEGQFWLAMSTSRNSVGRQMIELASRLDTTLFERSFEWRAKQSATRILLASRIYRAAHGGRLPSNWTGFLPILGTWPNDPYNGKPIIFNAKTEVVYSVGTNLADDGGEIGLRDVGVSLRL